ncbi:MAG: iron-containing redox enzyme family protein [Actinomycetota bacterium]|nr:MAG: iron-containing redox enzyme family protein [Actinomycetota bacterium]
MRTPLARGPISEAVIGVVRGRQPMGHSVSQAIADSPDPLSDSDLQLALAVSYELNYGGFVDEVGEPEWDETQLALRRQLETAFACALHSTVQQPTPSEEPVARQLRRVVEGTPGPPLSSFLQRTATASHYRDLLTQRAVYHLREADAHTWGIPRLRGRAKSALVEIQLDEYGSGVPGRAHAALFAATMRQLGLDDTYGASWDVAFAETLAANNLMSFFGLHRKHVAALAGHLAALELTSTVPNRRYAAGLRRLGFGADATAFFDEHVVADALHEQVAAVDLCGSLVRDDPGALGDVLWGAAACVELDARASHALFRRWQSSSVGAA